MKKHARPLLSALFFLCGIASFASLSWVHRAQQIEFLRREPYYHCPVTVFANRAIIRNDVYGKGYFGASRGSRGQRSHKGIDLLAKMSSPITAGKSGRVVAAGIAKGFGWYVEIRHSDGRLSRYAHLERILVSVGDWVLASQEIGHCGKSGNADDPRILPHLHFEIWAGDTVVDPAKLIDPSILVK